MSVPSPTRRRWPRRLALGVGVVVVLAVAIPYGYIHLIEKKAPPKLSLTPTGTAGTSTASGVGVSGTWTVGRGSLVGYRVDETLIGQKNVAVGRTGAVTGTIIIRGTSVVVATFTAQMASVKSDESQRDSQFDGRIMDVARYPTATFALTKPIALGSVPAPGTVHSYPATGNLTLRGQTHPVTFTVAAERTASGLEVQGDIPILFATWDVANPSFGSFVTTANHGILEFLLELGQGSTAATATTATTSAPAAGSGYGGGGPGAGGSPGITVSPTTTPPLTING